MDMGFDTNGPAGSPVTGRRPGEGGRPDWQGLIARFSAARAARHALGGADSRAGGVAAGSFDGASARVLSEYDASLSEINPVFWANRKPTRTMDSPVAGETISGGRG